MNENLGTSMQPALNPNSGSEDYVFLSKWAVRDMYVQRGDIISLISPKDPGQKLIKRIVGLQGNIKTDSFFFSHQLICL